MIFAILLFATSAAQANTKVPVTFIEALAPRDSTSSEKFKKDFEEAISLAKSLTADKLKKCGFELQTKSAFYDAGDPLQAKELATAEKNAGAWMIVGPRRSNHYIALVKGAGEVPSVSLMAGATEIKDLGKLHKTISPLNSDLAGVAAQEAASRLKKKATFLSIVSGDCLTCVDFAEYFEKSASAKKLNLIERVVVTGEQPDLEQIKEKVKLANPNFILLPNYSKVSIHIMNGLDGVFTGTYVGADGWGDSKFGYVQKASKSDAVQGFTVRGFPPIDKGLQKFGLGRKVLKGNQVPTGGPAMAILKIMDATSEVLCSRGVKSAATFSKQFSATEKAFRAPWGVSIYDLKNGEIKYKKSISLKD